MKARNSLPKQANNSVSYRHDGTALRRCAGILLCSLILMVGFFIAASQHFSMLDWSRKNVKLRQQREELKNEKQRLLFERESALSSQSLGKRAEKIGLEVIRAGQLSNLSAVFSDETKAAVPKDSAKSENNKLKPKTVIR